MIFLILNNLNRYIAFFSLAFSFIVLVRNCVKRAISYDSSVACGTADNNNVILRENNISHNRQSVPVNVRLTSCDASSKHLTGLHAFEKIDQKLVSDLSTLKNEIKTDEEVLSQDICQNALNKWSPSGCDGKDSALSLVQLTEKEDSSVATAEILQRYFEICDTILSDDGQHLIDHESDVTVESPEERDCVNDITETRERVSMSEDPVSLGHKLTLILPRCNCATSKLSRHFGSNAK